jgi:septal ring factor EnvC (AmiA/AmiB activator)
MFKQIIQAFKHTESVPLRTYVEKHTTLIENQLKFYNMIIVFGGGCIIWSIDNERKNVDKRFEQVDKRFEQVDKRFEQVDKRFEQVDKRFEQVDKRLETIEMDLKEIKNLFLVSSKK